MEIQVVDENEYLQWLQEAKDRIRNGQLAASLAVNKEALKALWWLGAALSEKQKRASWGDKIIAQLAKDLLSEFGPKSGFSTTQLKYFRRWYQFYSQNGLQRVDQSKTAENQAVTISPHSVDQLGTDLPELLWLVPWGHHIQIFTKSKSVGEAIFYLQQTVKHNWPRKMLVFQMESGLFQRKGRYLTNFERTLPIAQSALARDLLKDQYNLGFLELAEGASERELESAIINNIIRFLKELGPAFALVGKQYRLQVSDKEYILDLLFYHTRLHCYLVIELKVTDFKPEFAGKLEFYITAVDEHIKMPEDNPTIGLLLCKTADEIIVEYSLRSKTKPIGVAEYRHTLPKELRQELPAVDDLKKELSKEIVIARKPIDEKADRLKMIISKINTEEATQGKTDDAVIKLFDDLFRPLSKYLKEKCQELQEQFQYITFQFRYNNSIGMEDATLLPQLEKEYSFGSKLPDLYKFSFHIYLKGFKKAGLQAFDIYSDIELNLENYRYNIGPKQQKKFLEKLYHQFPEKTEIEEVGDMFFDLILDAIEEHISRIFPGIDEVE